MGIANPIHGDDGAHGAGYAGALVAGVRTYGWVAESAIEVLGASWLEAGWADVTMRRPVYVGDELRIVVARSGTAATCAVDVTVDGRVVLDGEIGLGPAAWLDDLDPPAPEPGREPPTPRPTYTIESAPVGQALTHCGASSRRTAPAVSVSTTWASSPHASRMTACTRGSWPGGWPR